MFLKEPYIWLIKLNVDWRIRLVYRHLREDALKHCVDINCKKNVFKPFSNVGDFVQKCQTLDLRLKKPYWNFPVLSGAYKKSQKHFENGQY